MLSAVYAKVCVMSDTACVTSSGFYQIFRVGPRWVGGSWGLLLLDHVKKTLRSVCVAGITRYLACYNQDRENCVNHVCRIYQSCKIGKVQIKFDFDNTSCVARLTNIIFDLVLRSLCCTRCFHWTHMHKYTSLLRER